MDKELKTKLVGNVINRITFIGKEARDKMINEILAIDDMDKEAEDAFVLAEKIKEKEALEKRIAEAQAVLETDVPILDALIKEIKL
jgi:hypothetical protein